MTKLLVGIGCDAVQELPASVLSFSIREQTEMPIEIAHLHRAEVTGIDDRLLRMQRTAFSLQRFLLATLMLQRGFDVAIYLDSDMLILRPIDDLVAQFRAAGHHIATVDTREEWRRQRQSSVMVMDRDGAERLAGSFLRFMRDEISYDDLIYLKTVGPIGVIDSIWNGLEYLDQDIALLHYTDMDRQPWLAHGNPNEGIWYANLWRFTRQPEGVALLKQAVTARHVRPALLKILAAGPSISARPNGAVWSDWFFVPPHRFRRLRSLSLRRLLAPVLNIGIAAQSWARDGQLNVR